MGTFFKVDRAIFDTEIWQDPEPYDMRSAWIWLIGMANFKEAPRVIRGQALKIKRGQLHVSMSYLAEAWHWSVGKVRRYIRLLEQLGMVQAHGTPNGTTLTIENYAKYQDVRQARGTPNGIADGTTDGTTGGTQSKNIKKDKEGEEYARTRATPSDPQPLQETIEEIMQWERELNERRRKEREARDGYDNTDDSDE